MNIWEKSIPAEGVSARALGQECAWKQGGQCGWRGITRVQEMDEKSHSSSMQIEKAETRHKLTVTCNQLIQDEEGRKVLRTKWKLVSQIRRVWLPLEWVGKKMPATKLPLPSCPREEIIFMIQDLSLSSLTAPWAATQ